MASLYNYSFNNTRIGDDVWYPKEIYRIILVHILHKIILKNSAVWHNLFNSQYFQPNVFYNGGYGVVGAGVVM